METKIIDNVKEAGIIVGIATGIGFTIKNVFKKSVINDPSSSLMNFCTWTGVVTGALFIRDYLIKEKVLPS